MERCLCPAIGLIVFGVSAETSNLLVRKATMCAMRVTVRLKADTTPVTSPAEAGHYIYTVNT
jgi:hypothetical protein